MDLEIEFEFPEVRVGTFGSVVITVWYSEASIRGLEAQRASFRKAIGRFGAASSLNVSVTVPRSPPEDSLRWLKENAEPTTDTTIASVVVLLSRGLSAVLARSYLAAVSLFSPQKLTVVRSLA